MQPDVSVVIPTYNREEYLRKAIASCFNGNRNVDVEVVVVDDGSTDRTREYLEGVDNECVRPIFQKHKGGQYARNRGLREAKGTYVKFLDDDDWLKEGALEKEYNALEESGADVSYGAYAFVESDGTVLRQERAISVEDPLAALLMSDLLTHLLRFTCRQSIIQGVRWDPELPCRQDVDFILSVATQDPDFVRVEGTIGFFRQHEGERVSRTAGQQNTVNTVRTHAGILLSTIEEMQKKGVLYEGRRDAAARGLWIWAHLLAAEDLTVFQRLHNKIQDLDPEFVPRRSLLVLSLLDRLIGPKGTEYVMYPLRKLRKMIGSIR